MKHRVLVTGGLGFIFSYVTQYFVQKGWDVVVIDNLSEGSHPEIIDSSFDFISEDLADESSFKTIIETEVDYIVHAAAITDVDYSIINPRRTMNNNVNSTLNVFKAAKQMPSLKKLLYVSTDEVYGECEYRKKETDIIFPRNPYSISKAVGSLMRTGYDNTYSSLKDKTTEIRMCNIFGQRQDTRKIMPQIKKSIETGYSIPLQNGGEGYREYLYVKEVPFIVDLVLEKGDRVYNVTNNDGFTVQQLIDKSVEITKKPVTYHDSNRPGHDLKYMMDNTRIKELGWIPHYTFEEAFKEYINGSAL